MSEIPISRKKPKKEYSIETRITLLEREIKKNTKWRRITQGLGAISIVVIVFTYYVIWSNF